MDRKLSDFPVSSEILPADLIPIVSERINKVVSFANLSSTTTNFNNKGITKNLVASVQGFTIPLTKTIVVASFAGTYQLPAGADGQEITIVSLVPINVMSSNTPFTSAVMGINSTITLLFIATIDKWVIKSSHLVTIT